MSDSQDAVPRHQEAQAASPKPVITIIGSINMDLATYTPRIPQPGETLTASAFQISLGGKGANQAAACAKLSRSRTALADGAATINMVGAVGDDGYADTAVSGLRSFGVGVAGIRRRAGAKTGVAVIVVEEDSGENRILLSPEANHTLTPEQFSKPFAEPVPSLIVLQLEIPLETVLQILDTARQQGIPVLLNPAPAQKIPAEYYSAISYLVPNETEAAILSGCDPSELDTRDGLSRVAQTLRGWGAREVLITLGGRGVFYSSSTGQEGLVPAEKVQVVDTTAAGDTFVGAFALQIVGGNVDVKSAVEAANRAAAKTVQRRGALVSIPWLDELDV
jgi:ribokinase